MARVAVSLVDRIPERGFHAIGLSGAPGSGKSTLAKLISSLPDQSLSDTLVISLDNYYLGKNERKANAAIHRLFEQRGVPGTHDWQRLVADLDRIREGEVDGLRLPRFSKLDDDRCPEDESITVHSPPRVVILEGWMVGAPPQDQQALERPVNGMEAKLDRNQRWRRMVNENLARQHGDLANRLDSRWFMKTPGWSKVVDWRWQQEQENDLRRNDLYLGTRQEVAAFLDQFERIATHMRLTCEQWADVIINVDHKHHLSIN